MAVEDRVPLLFAELIDRIAGAQSCVVDQDIQTTKGLNRSRNRTLRSFECGDAVSCMNSVAAGYGYLLGHL